MPGGGGKGKGGGGTTSTVNVNIPEPIDVDSTITVEGLNDIGLTLQGGDLPVKSESKQDLDLNLGGGEKPVRTESTTESTQDIKTRSEVVTDNDNKVSLDVKPLAVDLCTTTTVNAGALPQGVVRQPYHTHFGVTWLGIELLGFSLSGESKTVYDGPERGPSLEWPAQKSAPSKSRGGLRVRIK
jgi:hypothetical protein